MTNLSLFQRLDKPTFEFLIRLKAANDFWFMALIRCGRRDAKTVKQCINEAVKLLPKLTQFDIRTVNSFQICKAARAGALNETTFNDVIARERWYLYRYRTILDIQRDKNVLLQLSQKQS